MKRGSVEISFGMIFSIIIIIALIGVAIYAINIFLNISKTAELGLFHKELQKTVDDVWSSASTNKVVSFSLPKSIEFVCFGSIGANSVSARYSDQLSELREYSSGFEQQTKNTFLYPPLKAKEFAYHITEKVDFSALGNFDCFESRNGVVTMRLTKGEFDSLVKIGHE